MRNRKKPFHLFTAMRPTVGTVHDSLCRCCAEIGDLAKTVTRGRCSANVRAGVHMLKPNNQRHERYRKTL